MKEAHGREEAGEETGRSTEELRAKAGRQHDGDHAREAGPRPGEEVERKRPLHEGGEQVDLVLERSERATRAIRDGVGEPQGVDEAGGISEVPGTPVGREQHLHRRAGHLLLVGMEIEDVEGIGAKHERDECHRRQEIPPHEPRGI